MRSTARLAAVLIVGLLQILVGVPNAVARQTGVARQTRLGDGLYYSADHRTVYEVDGIVKHRVSERWYEAHAAPAVQAYPGARLDHLYRGVDYDSSTRPAAAVVGDSYAAGFGPHMYHDDEQDAWYPVTLGRLQWSLDFVITDPAGGFLASGRYGTYEQMLLAHPIPSEVGEVLLQGGYNDSFRDPILEASALLRVLDLIHGQAPHAQIVLVGMFQPLAGIYTRSQYANQEQVADAIAEPALRRPGDRFVDGRTCSFERVWQDVHPTALGHRQIGECVADQLVAQP